MLAEQKVEINKLTNTYCSINTLSKPCSEENNSKTLYDDGPSELRRVQQRGCFHCWTAQSTLQHLPHLPIHTHIHALMATAHQEQFWVQYLAQGHFNMQLGGAGILTSDLPISRRELYPPRY